MTASRKIMEDIVIIESELHRATIAEGMPEVEVTGNIIYNANDESTWYEIQDEYNTISWVSLDFEEDAAFGEKLVAAAEKSEIFNY